MKTIYCLALIIFVGNVSNKNNDGDKIYWTKDIQLSWNDFKEKPDTNCSFFSGTEWRIKIERNIFDDRVKFIVSCYFDKNLSWVKLRNKSENVLQHEKGHFDIAEIFTRMLRKKFSHHRFNKQNIDNMITLCLKDIIRNCEYSQQQYDFETQHSGNLIAQKIWQARISNNLQELDKYRFPEFEVPLKN